LPARLVACFVQVVGQFEQLVTEILQAGAEAPAREQHLCHEGDALIARYRHVDAVIRAAVGDIRIAN
jgi:hypothetical protein